MAEAVLNENTEFYEVKIGYPGTDGKMRYYYRTIEAETPEEAENTAVGDFFAFGQMEQVISVKEISAEQVNRMLNDSQQDLVLRARYNMDLHRAIIHDDRHGIMEWLNANSDIAKIASYADHRDMVSHFDIREMASMLIEEDRMPVGSLYGD